MNARGQRSSSDDGAVAVIAALILTVLLISAAFVIDLGFLRADRVSSKSTADLAVTAAAVEYTPSAPGSALDACLEAVSYAQANLRLSGAASLVAASGHACEDKFPAAPDDGSVGETCQQSWIDANAASDETDEDDALSDSMVRYRGGEYTVTITLPVPDSSRLLAGQPLNADIDGRPCERIGVHVVRDRTFALGGITGTQGGTTAMSAVARWLEAGEEEQFASLVLLERQGCSSLSAAAQWGVVVETLPDPDPTDPDTGSTPGSITIDTRHDSCNPNATGPPNGPVTSVQGSNANDRVRVFADGGIYMHGLQAISPSDVTRVYQPPRVPEQLGPDEPLPGPRITRSPVDHLVNCMESYPTGHLWSPNYAANGYVAQPIGPCEDGTDPYIQQLHNTLQGLREPDIADVGPLSEWLVYPRDVDGGNADCTGDSWTLGPDHLSDVTGSGTGRKWYIDCGIGVGGSDDEFAPNDVRFIDVDIVVSRNGINLGSTDRFSVDGGAGEDGGAILYLQSDENSLTSDQANRTRGLQRGSQSVLRLEHTFVYSENGWVRIGGNVGFEAPAVRWHGPTRDMSCGVDDGVPTAGCFAPLSFWSNSRHAHELGGQGVLDVAGTFFTPNATPFSLKGQANQDLAGAQFFANRLRVDGQALVTLTPDPEINVATPIGGSGLIR